MTGKKKAPQAPGPERATAGAHAVALTGANPAQSNAGVIEELETNVEGVSLSVSEGARAVLAVGKSATHLLTQAELIALQQAIGRAVQSTY